MLKIRSKSDSWVMRAIGWLMHPFNKGFMTSYWTTWFGTIYAPTSVDVNSPSELARYKSTIEHEKVHLADQKNHPILFPVTYVFPPVFFAYGRWYWERRAYLVTLSYYNDVVLKKMKIERIIEVLSGPEYFWTWPKSLMRKWFYNKLGLKR